MSALEANLADYLRLRRALGHKLDEAGRQLAKFVAYLDATGQDTVTMSAVMGFVSDPALDPASTIPSRRLTAVRGFARHLSGIDPATEIPPAGLVVDRPRHRTPFVFSDADVGAVARSAAASSPFPLRKATLSTMIGLLAVTGLRVGEAIRLDQDDVDWTDGLLRVRNTKFGKGRDVPVAPSTLEALVDYRRQRDRTRPASSTLFVSLSGTPVVYANFGLTFRRAVDDAGIAAGSPIRPRVHDRGCPDSRGTWVAAQLIRRRPPCCSRRVSQRGGRALRAPS